MKEKVKKGSKLIAKIIEEKPQKLKLFLIQEGIELNPFVTKDQLQKIVLIALKDPTFRDNFAVFIYENLDNKFSNADGLFTATEFPPLFSNESVNQASNSGPFDPISFPQLFPDSSKTETNTTSENPKGGFFGGFNLNTGLDFIKDTLNSVAQIKQSDKELAILNAEIEKERENLTPKNKNNTGTYVVIGLLVVAAVSAGIYFYQKKSK